MKKILLGLCVLLSVSAFGQQINNKGLTIAAQQSADGKQYRTLSNRHVPYADTAQFLATISSTRRHIGQIAYIYNGINIEVWQFVGGIGNGNLIKILPGSGDAADFNNLPEYANNAAALAANAQPNSIYSLPYNNGIYGLAIVKSGTTPPITLSSILLQNGNTLTTESGQTIIIE